MVNAAYVSHMGVHTITKLLSLHLAQAFTIVSLSIHLLAAAAIVSIARLSITLLLPDTLLSNVAYISNI